MTTVGALLQPDSESIAHQAANLLGTGRAAVRLPPADLYGQVRAGFTALHDIRIGDVLQLAWQTSRTLREAAKQSVRTRTPQPVHLNGYAVPCDYAPELELLVNQKRVAVIHFGLRVTLELFNFTGTVHNGRLVRLHSDVFDVTAALSAEGHLLAQRTTHLDLAVELPVPAAGIPLLRGV